MKLQRGTRKVRQQNVAQNCNINLANKSFKRGKVNVLERNN